MPLNTLKLFSPVALLILLAVSSSAQSISGPSTVNAEDNVTYSISGVDADFPNWTVTSGATVTFQYSGRICEADYCANIYFTSAGTKTIRFKDGNTTIASRTVTVQGTPPPPPNATITTSHPFCGSTTITRTNNPPTGVRWYWQTSASGTSTALGFGSSITRTTSGPIYLRARTSVAGIPPVWSNSAQSISYSVDGNIPSQPGGSSQARCGSGVVTLTASPGSNGNVVRWYSQAIGGPLLHTGTAYSTPSLSSTTTYYIATSNTTTQCSSGRRSIQAIINPIPSLANGSNNSRCGTGTVTLTASPGSNGNTIRWYSAPSGGTLLHTGTSYTTPGLSASKKYYAASYHSSTGCLDNDRRAITAVIHPIPSLASGSGNSRCGTGSVALTATPGSNGNTIRWYSASSGGTLLHTGTTYHTPTILSSTTYYAATYNSSTGCIDSDRRAITATIDPVPALAGGTDAERCGSGAVTLSASPGANGNNIRWYSASSGGTLLHTGTSYPTPSLSSTTTYYAASWNSTTFCEDSDRTAIQAVINPIPGLASGIDYTRCGSGTVTLTATPGTHALVVRWYDAASGGTRLHTGNTYEPNISSTTTYYVASYSTATGCEDTDRYAITGYVDVPPNAGSITGTTEKFGVASGSVSISGYSGNIVRWEYQTTGVWDPITHTDASLPYNNILETTKYRAVLVNGECSIVYSAMATITILPELILDLGSTTALRPGTSSTISTDDSHASYRWFKDNTEIVGETSHQLEVTSPGAYKVMATSHGGASGTTENAIISNQLAFNGNAVTTYTYRIDATDADDPFAFDIDEQSITTQVLDGLGRPIQQVALQASPLQKDVVTPIAYDELGRQTKSYLPYVATDLSSVYKSNALASDYELSDHYDYYMNTSSHTSAVAFSESSLEPSPLNRLLEQGAPGPAWQLGQNTMKYTYDMADSAEVLRWGDTDTLLIAAETVYGPGELYENTTFDEDSSQMMEYINMQGQTILKKSQVNDSTWAETYYLYDKYGQLAVVLPPEAIVRLDTAFFNKSAAARTAFLNTWAFLYKYDGRNRITMKKVPGADSVFMVYDRWDRLVLTQDGNQRKNNNQQWLFTKYDALNRPVMTGLATIAGTTKAVRDSVEASVHRAESFDTTGINEYTDETFPPNDSIDNYLTVTYYDNYDWDTTGLSYTNPAGLTLNTAVKGQITGTLTRTGVGMTGASQGWIKSASYYDGRYRAIQTQSTNHLGGSDIITNYYDFIGQVTKSITQHNNGVTTRTITRRFEYDHVGRLLNTFHQINNDSEVQIVANHYNELGELTEKGLHSKDNGLTFEQEVNYAYNIRGWLTRINDPAATDPARYFAMQLQYDETGQYNGNIGAASWKNPFETTTNTYTYGYDALNRLESAAYSTTGSSTMDFDVSNITYDGNGNILTLQRTGNHDDQAAQLFDDLDYDHVGNQLWKVTDASGKDTGFKDGANTAQEYTYDANGNMISDANKGIDSISYNHLNLPVRVEMNADGSNRIAYVYDAAGIKLAQLVYGADTLTKRTDYVGEFIYESIGSATSQLQFIQHDEGRVVRHPEPVEGSNYEYQYHLKDHLGNVRTTFKTADDIEASLATFESSQTATETEYFIGYDGMTLVQANLFNHTSTTDVPGANTSIRLNGSTNETEGLGKSLKVKPGDVIDMEVYAKYIDNSNSGGWTSLLTTLAGQITSGDPSVISENGGMGPNVFPFAHLFDNGSDNSDGPDAYMNFMIFDLNFGLLDQGFVPVTSAAEEDGTDVNHEHLSVSITIDEPGFVYVYLSNENSTPIDVFFDDFEVKQKHTRIVSKDDYYPFGLTFNSYQRTVSTAQNFKYNGKELIEETNWYDYGARMYTPDLGRWFSVDPLAEATYDLTPYHYVYNNPLIFIDPDGMFGDYYGEKGEYLGNDGIDDGKVYQTTAATYAKYDTGGNPDSFKDGSEQPSDFEGLKNDENTHYLGETNEFGLIQLTGMGNENIVNNTTSEDSYSYTKKDGTASSTGKHGDDWVKPSTAAAFNAAVNAFAKGEGNSNSKIVVNDGSAFNPDFNLGHTTHSTGKSIDYRFVNGTSSGSTNINNLSSDQVQQNARLVNVLRSAGFPINYSQNGTIPGTTHKSGHHNHAHTSRPNPKTK